MPNIIANWISKVNNIPEIKHKDFVPLFKKYKKTKEVEIRNQLIESHLKLCVKPALYYSKFTNSSDAFFDLINECVVKMTNALEEFNIGREVYFSQFVKQRLWRACYWYLKRKIMDKNLENLERIGLPEGFSYIDENFKTLENRELLSKLTNTLNTKELNVLQLYYFEGKNWETIAKQLKVTRRTIEVIRNKAFKKIRSTKEYAYATKC